MTWLPCTEETSYKVFYKSKSDSEYKAVDEMLIRSYGPYYRLDIVGL